MKKLVRVFTLLVAIILIATSFAACSLFNNPDNSSQGNTGNTQPKEKITVDYSSIEFKVEELAGFYYVTVSGTAQNTSGKNLSYAQIIFTVFDASDAQIGTALANTNNLSAGVTWKFSANGMFEIAPTRCRLSEVTAF